MVRPNPRYQGRSDLVGIRRFDSMPLGANASERAEGDIGGPAEEDESQCHVCIGIDAPISDFGGDQVNQDQEKAKGQNARQD